MSTRSITARWRLGTLFALLALCCFGSFAPQPLFAQAQTTGKIVGKVVDEASAAVEGAEVVATATSLGIERKTTTGATGEFLLSLLPVGEYTLSIVKPGFQPQVYSLRVGVGETAPIDAVLAPGEAISDTIEVYGTASDLETTTIGENFSYDQQIAELPIIDRGIERVAEYSPNISYGPTANTLSIAGAPSFDTVVLLDGAEISDPYFSSAADLFLEDAVREVQVLTSGISARYGRFQGGVINAITKSGTNAFEGTLRGELEKQSWNSETPFGETQDDTLNPTYQATLGGPLVTDRAWFFAGGRTFPTRSEAETTLLTNQSYSTVSEETRWQLKLTGALTPNQLLEVSHLDFDSTDDQRDGLPAGEVLALGSRRDPNTTDTLAYQAVLSSNTFVDFQATQKEVRIFSGGDPSKGDPFIDLLNFQVFHNHWWDANDPSVRDSRTASLSISKLADGGRFGSHTLEGGLQYVESKTGGENRQSSTGFNLLAFNSGGDFATVGANGEVRYNLRSFDAIRWAALPLGGDQTLENPAIYLQDTVALGKWRFDLGLRYERYDGTGPLPQFDLAFDSLSPRLGVTYAFDEDWQLQASWGRYSSRFNDSVANSITGVSSAPRITTLYAGPDLLNSSADEIQAALRNDDFWPIVIGFQSPEFPTSFLADDIEAPYADDLNLSIRRALPNGTGSAVLSYVDRKYSQLIDDFVGSVCETGVAFGRPCPASDTILVSAPDGSPLASVDTTIWANNPQARRSYRALTALWDFRPSNKFQVFGNYTYSKTRGNYEGEGANTPASGSPIGNYPRSSDFAATNPDGALSGDIPHRLNLLASYRFDGQRRGALTIGGALRYQSGLPYSLTASVPLLDDSAYLGDAGTTYTHYFSRRGEFRFDDWWSADLSLRYDLPLWRELGTFVKLSVLNVTNNDAVVQFSTAGISGRDPQTGAVQPWQAVGNCGPGDRPSTSCTGFGRIRSQADYQDPRQIQLTFAFDF